jgi:bifunctional oligoribonuclease and PAP phosphatase NrnA
MLDPRPQTSTGDLLSIAELIDSSQSLLVMQADMPDGDSLGSALALEEILSDLGKDTALYSYNQPPEHLRYLEGWDRVAQQPPKQFDLAILVDASGTEMIQATLDHFGSELTKKPWLIIDHHPPGTDFPAATVTHIDQTAAATAQILVGLASGLKWTINSSAANKLAAAILSDSLGLTTPHTSHATVTALAELVRLGANLSSLNDRRREFGALTPELMTYKARLLSQIQYHSGNRIAISVIDPDNAKQSKQHNPTSLVLTDMFWVRGIELAAVVKDYGTKTKVILRSHHPVAAKIARKFGGGGHDNAASYRTDNQSLDQTIRNLVEAYEALSP